VLRLLGNTIWKYDNDYNSVTGSKNLKNKIYVYIIYIIFNRDIFQNLGNSELVKIF
jgi:hypothetical protein